MGQGFRESYVGTLGTDFSVKKLGNITLQIWDVAGQPNFQRIRKSYYSGSSAGVMVFDVTNRDSMFNTEKWAKELLSSAEEKIPIILVGNKIDVRENSSDFVQHSEQLKYAKNLSKTLDLKVESIESSALSGFNVGKIFDIVVDRFSTPDP